MPKRNDLKKIAVLGAGPIIIGQACEFDYSGTQGCKALRAEGYEVVLVNSNPATIMTDPEFGDRTYIEPLTPEVVAEILQIERPGALLPTLGGQTALNLAAKLFRDGTLDALGIELIGARAETIERAEDREDFRELMASIGVETCRGRTVASLGEARVVAEEVGFPLIVRPSYTLGGTGGGVAFNREELDGVVERGLTASPVGEALVEESILGWKEYELEVMRDAADNFVVICSIENIDPVGVHTGDSITVAPQMTLSDREYQAMRDEAAAVIRAVGVETGGSNIQFAVDPRTGRRIVIEMNPRVSRSSALASKATGYPIAKIAAKLAVGYRLDEIMNDITGTTPACFEPSIDYVVVKAPRFDFAKFPGASDTLGPQMRSVGETMSIARTFKEAMQKAMRGLEVGATGLAGGGRAAGPRRWEHLTDGEMALGVGRPSPDRIFGVMEALRRGRSVEEINEWCAIDPWFLRQFEELMAEEKSLLRAAAMAGAAGAAG
jgi:carbamoyl-phosphate synthase large subunit